MSNAVFIIACVFVSIVSSVITVGVTTHRPAPQAEASTVPTIEVPFTYNEKMDGYVSVKIVTLPTGERLAVVNRTSAGIAVCYIPEKAKP